MQSKSDIKWILISALRSFAAYAAFMAIVEFVK